VKAFLLSAGLGERLRPITNNLPKCLVPINNIPLIEYWLRLFRKYSIKDVLINTHYLHDKIENYINNNVNDINIIIKYEPKLLGSLGSILNNKSFVQKEKSLMVMYSDNLTNLNIENLMVYHDTHDLPITMGLFRCSDPSQCGIATLDVNQIVVDFEEKPTNPRDNLANAGIYIFDVEIFDSFYIPNDFVLDIGTHLLPKFIGKMKGHLIKDFLLDIGTLENYNFANKYVAGNTNDIKFDTNAENTQHL